ncbi:hypothetical protein HY410_00685 [Candidatus Gottesmanbacteria bacterium]|nr:hypothetical protein [Candidatus Gottesmanbacteria bacterium]
MPISPDAKVFVDETKWLYDKDFTASLVWPTPEINDKGQTVYPRNPTSMTAEDYPAILPKIVRRDKALADQTLILPGGTFLNAGIFFDYFSSEVVTKGPEDPNWVQSCIYALVELHSIARVEAAGEHVYPPAISE